MKESFTRSMSFLHTWAGLVFGWLLFSIFFTGTLSVFFEEITTWASPQLHVDSPLSRRAAIERGAHMLNRIAPDSRLWRITLPNDRDRALELQWRDDAGKTQLRRIDPSTGLQAVDTAGGAMFTRFHYRLHLNRDTRPIGFWIVGVCGIAMLVACIGGIIIHKRIFRDFFVFRPFHSGPRAWTDAHNVLSVLPLPFHILITLSGLSVYYWLYVPAGVASLYGGTTAQFRTEVTYDQYRSLDVPAGPVAASFPLGAMVPRADEVLGHDGIATVYVRDPGHQQSVVEFLGRRDDRIAQQVNRVVFDGASGAVRDVVVARPPMLEAQSFLTGLHFVLFGGTPMRWLYFFCGLAGTATIGAGVLLFAVKRRDRREAAAAPRFHWLVDRMNVTAIMGPMIASVAFFWGTRLIPEAVAYRQNWEAAVFFAAFALTGAFAFMRRTPRAWSELLYVLAALSLTLPLSGLLFPHSWIADAMARGDGILLGVDITALAGGAIALFIARWLGARAPVASSSLLRQAAA